MLSHYVSIYFIVTDHAQLRDWSLITGREGLQNGRGGGASEVFTPTKRVGRNSLSHAEGGHNKF